PGGALFEELRSREAEQQDGRIARPVAEVFGEVEKRRLPPVNVVDHERERTLASALLERFAHRPEDLLRGARREGALELVLGGSLPEDLDHRRVRDALAVREAQAR